MNGDPRSHGLWEASAPPPPATLPLRDELLVDAVVVGGGFTGLSAALHLARGGASVALLEAVEIGFGASGRNVGLVNAGMWVMPSALADALGPVHGPRLLALLGDGPSLVYELVEKWGIPCEAVRRGTLHCAVGNAGLRNITQRATQWQALGAPVHLLGAQDTASKTGTRAFSGALLDLRAGTIQPLAYARGLAAAAIASGARLFSRSPVTAVDDLHGTWRLHAGAGSVQARWVLVATNTYTGPDGAWRQLAGELVRLPYFNLATAPLPEHLRRSILPEGQGAWDTRSVLSSMRMDSAGRMVFGSVGALRGAGHAVHRNWGRRALARLYPQLQGVDFEHEWYGWIGMTGDALPRLHRLARNTVAFSGYNGRGIATGTTFGRELARLVLGETTEEALPLPLTEVQPARLRRVREALYEAGAQIVHGATARW